MTQYLKRLFPLLLATISAFTCSEGKVDMKNMGVNIDTIYRMRTLNVNTLVSDSGLTKARIISPEWLIYDLPNRSEWYFPRGIRMERFDSIKRSSTAFIVADTATYELEAQRWILSGHVRVHGMQGERLYTPRLYWMQGERRVYSNDTTYFFTKGRELRGDSFQAKDDLSNYTILNNRGTVEYNEEEASSPTPSTPSVPTASSTTPLVPTKAPATNNPTK